MSWNDLTAPDPPLPNSYWVQHGRLLAGEYPGSMSRADAMERIQRLLRAGVTSFIDLTEEGELPEYDQLLPDLTEQRIRYQRFPVVDHGVPDSDAHMVQIVEAIDAELAAGRCVYVHCHAGIGRTGTSIACHLIRGGLANEAALAHLQTLWRQSARSRRWPSVPETSEQTAFILQWRGAAADASARPANFQARYEGALMGLALGDALGALVAKSAFDGATLCGELHEGGLRPGLHTATTCAVIDSLLAHGEHNADDQMRRYLLWMRATPDAPIPPEFKRALAVWQWSKKPNAGSHDPANLDPHSLPRTLAAAMFVRGGAAAAIDLAADISRTTQQSPVVLDLCRVWAGLLVDALHETPKTALQTFDGPAMKVVRQRTLKPQVQALFEEAPAPTAASDALGVTRAALSGFAQTRSFRDAVLSITTQMRAPPAAAALCGALCGAHYGVAAIPPEWRRRIAEESLLRSTAHRLSA